ncbi:toxin-antitoxin system YwqK family antitoxin [Flavicella sediminum]|uniref:toxin-antitoxin system YwqK family antitoxin n=1 Tax=Flavicella sediminum TaxID=2585141 RepID=UPI00111D3BE2|nr:hypothetical protein [Flavicella sediminum]
MLILVLFTSVACTHEHTVVDITPNEFSNVKIKNRLVYYNNKIFSGEIVSFYDSKKTKQKLSCFYVEGAKHGQEKKWYKDGAIQTLRFYTNNIKTGKHQGWWENGQKKFEFIFNDEGQYAGVLKEWYQNGIPYRVFNYKNGREEGSQKMWKSDGAIKANYVVANGERFGLIGLKKCDPVSTK